MSESLEAIIASGSTTEEQIAIKILELFSGQKAIEIDLRNAPSAERCQEVLDVLEGAFGLKRKKIKLHVAVNDLSKEVVSMVRHSDVITEVIVDGVGREASLLVGKFRNAVFGSTKVRLS